MKKWSLVFVLIFLLVSTGSVFAEGNVKISKNEQFTETKFLAGNVVEIDGNVDSDVFAFGSKIIVNGKINGDLIGAAQTVEINGDVNGNVRMAAQEIDIKGNVERNVLSATQKMTIQESGIIGGDVIAATEQFDVNGIVGKSFFGAMNEMNIAGTIKGNVRLEGIGEVQFYDNGKVNGHFSYASGEILAIDKDRISGNVVFKKIENVEEEQSSFSFIGLVLTVLKTILLWVIFRTIFYKGLPVIKTMFNHPFKYIGWGALALFVGPIVALLLMITVIAIPLSLLYGTVLVILSYVSKIFVGMALGEEVCKRTRLKLHPYIQECLGVLILAGIISLPFIGWFLHLGTILLFVGFVWTLLLGSERSV